MLRKIARQTAKHNMQLKGVDIFGKYAAETVAVFDKRSGKFQEKEVNRSFFARSWRSWL